MRPPRATENTKKSEPGSRGTLERSISRTASRRCGRPSHDSPLYLTTPLQLYCCARKKDTKLHTPPSIWYKYCCRTAAPRVEQKNFEFALLLYFYRLLEHLRLESTARFSWIHRIRHSHSFTPLLQRSTVGVVGPYTAVPSRKIDPYPRPAPRLSATPQK